MLAAMKRDIESAMPNATCSFQQGQEPCGAEAWTGTTPVRAIASTVDCRAKLA